MAEYRNKPTEFREPTREELLARNKRNIALAIGLVVFMVFIFITMISRGIGAA